MHPGVSLALPEPNEPSAAGSREGRRFWTVLGLFALVLALSAALATFLILIGVLALPVTETHLYLINGVPIALLLWVVGGQALSLFRARRAGLAASALHARIVGLFALVATAPIVLVMMAAVGWMLVERGLDNQFSFYIRGFLTTSTDVARAYQELQCRTIGREINLMAADISRARPALEQNRDFFRDFMRSRAVFLGFPVAMLIKADLTVIERIEVKPMEGLPPVSKEDIAAAADLEAWCLIPQTGNVFRGVLKVPAFEDAYLVVARAIDPKALEFPAAAEQARVTYEGVSERKRELQIEFATLYAMISIILLLSATWIGLNFANYLVAPVRRLINATDQVASGNFYVQVPSRRTEGDLGHLAETFNKMTAELRLQHDRLTAARDLIDRRRRFTEAVLSGVSAGVISIDGRGLITVVNPSAERLLHSGKDRLMGKPVIEAVPELTPIVAEALGERPRLPASHIAIQRGGLDRMLMVRVAQEHGEDGEAGAIITLDDITDLVTAQRTAAWADVARRIAHEIKNPLTPIQLSAERIRRKYGKLITTDREIFDQCTDTIVRQVDDIKRMVDEFSSFARMPKPTPEVEDLAGTVRQVVFLMRVGNPELAIEDRLPDGPVMARFDRRLLSQAVTNIIKNATEAISAVPAEERGEGRIEVAVTSQGGQVAVTIMDNGKGFPKEHRNRLLEPYMTTRDGGTGLGLAIVGKILEEHGGGIELLDRPDGARGAVVRLWLPEEGAVLAPVADKTADALEKTP
jgi:two-component system nitrogen regulation sensor histidine kinase NtrY